MMRCHWRRLRGAVIRGTPMVSRTLLYRNIGNGNKIERTTSSDVLRRQPNAATTTTKPLRTGSGNIEPLARHCAREPWALRPPARCDLFAAHARARKSDARAPMTQRHAATQKRTRRKRARAPSFRSSLGRGVFSRPRRRPRCYAWGLWPLAPVLSGCPQPWLREGPRRGSASALARQHLCELGLARVALRRRHPKERRNAAGAARHLPGEPLEQKRARVSASAHHGTHTHTCLLDGPTDDKTSSEDRPDDIISASVLKRSPMLNPEEAPARHRPASRQTRNRNSIGRNTPKGGQTLQTAPTDRTSCIKEPCVLLKN